MATSAPVAVGVLRVGFGVLFLWLGILKVLPGVSPAEPLMRLSLPASVPIDAFIRFAAIWEILAGLGFISGRLPRITLLMVFATMCITLSIPIMAAGRVSQTFPFLLTFEGEYVVKELVTRRRRWCSRPPCAAGMQQPSSARWRRCRG